MKFLFAAKLNQYFEIELAKGLGVTFDQGFTSHTVKNVIQLFKGIVNDIKI